MSDEQTELLRQILQMQKEQLAFARQQRDEVMAIQHLALARQAGQIRTARILIALMAIAVAVLVASMVITRNRDEAEWPVRELPRQQVDAGDTTFNAYRWPAMGPLAALPPAA